MDKRKLANQQVKDRLLAALVEFAGRKDWSKVTVTELVEQAGVARASFYRNFSSVEELVDYGIRQVTERYHAGKPEGREGFRDRALVEYKFRFYRENAKLVREGRHVAARPRHRLRDSRVGRHAPELARALRGVLLRGRVLQRVALLARERREGIARDDGRHVHGASRRSCSPQLTKSLREKRGSKSPF